MTKAEQRKLAQQMRQAIAANNDAANNRRKIQRLMDLSRLTTEQATEAVNSGIITSDEMFNYFEHGSVIKLSEAHSGPPQVMDGEPVLAAAGRCLPMVRTIIDWWKPDNSSDVYVEVRYRDDSHWSGWIDEERWALMKDEELQAAVEEAPTGNCRRFVVNDECGVCGHEECTCPDIDPDNNPPAAGPDTENGPHADDVPDQYRQAYPEVNSDVDCPTCGNDCGGEQAHGPDLTAPAGLSHFAHYSACPDTYGLCAWCGYFWRRIDGSRCFPKPTDAQFDLTRESSSTVSHGCCPKCMRSMLASRNGIRRSTAPDTRPIVGAFPIGSPVVVAKMIDEFGDPRNLNRPAVVKAILEDGTANINNDVLYLVEFTDGRVHEYQHWMDVEAGLLSCQSAHYHSELVQVACNKAVNNE